MEVGGEALKSPGVPRHQHQVVPLGGQRARESETDARGGSGDHRERHRVSIPTPAAEFKAAARPPHAGWHRADISDAIVATDDGSDLSPDLRTARTTRGAQAYREIAENLYVPG